MKERIPVPSYFKWANSIPSVFYKFMLGSKNDLALNVENDPNGLAIFKHYHNLIPMAREVRKPIFLLKLADEAIGAHYQDVLRTYADFNMLTEKILEGINA